VAFSRPAGITEFGHLCLDEADVREAYRFWSGLFNIRVSDWIGDWARLMRLDAVHHKLELFQGSQPGLCHINFQVASLDDLMRNWRFFGAAAGGDRVGDRDDLAGSVRLKLSDQLANP
jgi:2,3-dihydroxy-p-cumate/2,3-dihydroxybenzoate 3,4-dioxygenase